SAIDNGLRRGAAFQVQSDRRGLGMERLTRKAATFLASLAVTAAVLLPSGVAHAANPGANGLIIFETGVGFGIHEINVENPDGTGLRTLIPSGGFSNYQPAWSPDGSRFAWAHG